MGSRPFGLAGLTVAERLTVELRKHRRDVPGYLATVETGELEEILADLSTTEWDDRRLAATARVAAQAELSRRGT